jgi:hypothetical protein
MSNLQSKPCTRSRRLLQETSLQDDDRTVDSTFDMLRVACQPNVANNGSSLSCERRSFDVQVLDDANRVAIGPHGAVAVDGGFVADFVGGIVCSNQRCR